MIVGAEATRQPSNQLAPSASRQKQNVAFVDRRHRLCGGDDNKINVKERVVDARPLHAQNRLLASLPDTDFELLSSRMRTVPLLAGTVLHEPGSEVSEVYFPLAGAVSLGVVLHSSEVVQAGVVGREGTIGGIAALDGRVGCTRAEVNIEGRASTVHIGHLRQIAEDSEALRSLLIRYQEYVLCQAQWTAACNASHSLKQRLCRLLLRFWQTNDHQPLPLTQELLAELLGVSRTSVTVIAHQIGQAGFLRIRRGHIELLKPEALQDAACECNERISRHYEMLFGDAPWRSRQQLGA